MRSNFAGRIRELEVIAARIRRNVLEICRQRGSFAAQGVALADVACLHFDELRPDGKGWFHNRIVLSNGHDAVMTYGALAEHGSYTMDELKTNNADGTGIDQSPIEGRLGIEITAGSLGQGPSQAAGMARAEHERGSGKRIYRLFSDGELQEGIVWEAAMFAGHQKPSNPLFIIDNNNMQASGRAQDVLGVEPVLEKFEAFGFAARRVNRASVGDIHDAFDEARNTADRPYAMVCDTRLFSGIDCLRESLPAAHYVSKTGADRSPGIAEISATIDTLAEVPADP